MAALTLAVPSKGRLQEQVNEYFADAGATLKQAAGARGYRATLAGLPDIEVMLLSASEIASSLISGDIHLGVTGEDLLREQAPELAGRIHLIKPLGFGFANVVVAVPQYWIDVSTMADLDDVCAAFAAKHRRRLRIATKYLQLTRGFFAHMGISDYRIVESAGATEGAPAAGTAEAIVDITTTGATLAANDLKVLEDGTILKSQAQLAASLRAVWKRDALAAAARLTSRIAARELARNSYLLRARIGGRGEAIVAALAKLGCSVLSQPASKNGAHVILCRRERLSDAVAQLREHGVRGSVAAEPVDYVFGEVNPLMQRLQAALK